MAAGQGPKPKEEEGKGKKAKGRGRERERERERERRGWLQCHVRRHGGDERKRELGTRDRRRWEDGYLGGHNFMYFVHST